MMKSFYEEIVLYILYPFCWDGEKGQHKAHDAADGKPYAVQQHSLGSHRPGTHHGDAKQAGGSPAGGRHAAGHNKRAAKAAAKAGRHKGSAKRQRHAVEQRRPTPIMPGMTGSNIFPKTSKFGFSCF